MNSRRVRAGYDRHGREVGAVLDLSYGKGGPTSGQGDRTVLLVRSLVSDAVANPQGPVETTDRREEE